jgi:hypothetical protein
MSDIIARLRCDDCGARDGFRVTVKRDRTDQSNLTGRPPPRTVIAEPD